jgi:CheY-like chemotaxis protein
MKSTTTRRRPVEILLVEDNPGDVQLTRELFRECATPPRLHVAADGESALAFLRRLPPHPGAARPDLILLDFNLPRKDGREVLAEIKADPELKRIPVIVLTTSQAEADIQYAYDHHASCYLAKPIDLDQFHRMVKAIEAFWLELAMLPGR